MKLILSIAAGVVIVALGVILTITMKNDAAALDTANGTITDFSNRLDSAQIRIAERENSILTLSNSLADVTAATLTLSNALTTAQSTNAAQADLIADLNKQLADAAAEKQTLDKNITDLTKQMAQIIQQRDLSQTNLANANAQLVQAGKDYALLEHRFREDVAARVIVERRFNNYLEVQAQEKKLYKNNQPWITAQSIYAGLNVEVNSNGTVRVLSPD